MVIQPFAHPHPLSLIDNGNEYILCHRCRRPLSGPTYGCRECVLLFHKYCVDEVEPEVQCFFHPCPLVLFTSGGRCCPACEKYIFGFGYGCNFSCDFYVHVECALKAMAEDSDEEHNIPHFTHPHPLKPLDFNQQKHLSVTRVGEDAYNSEDEFYCDVCEDKRHEREPVYYCADCKFIVDLKCVISEVLPLISKNDLSFHQVDVTDNDNDDNKDNDDNDDHDHKDGDDDHHHCHDDNASRWEISKVLYKIEKLEQTKNGFEKGLERATRDLHKAKNRFEKLVVDAHKKKKKNTGPGVSF
ncbi:hypothetical protein GQ457_15G026110 [Hibiscus cannabinus]